MCQTVPWRILLVEDSRTHQYLLVEALKRAGHDLAIHIAENGADMLDALRQQTVDCVVLDYELPDGTAAQWLQSAAPLLQDCPAVVVSSSDDQHVVISTIRNGGVDFLPKHEAIDGQALWMRVQQAIQRTRRSRRERRRVERRARHLARLAETDALTGLSNRHHLDRCFDEGYWRDDRRQHVGCAMIDVDHFKRINDTHGHVAGDVVLRAVAQAIRRHAGRGVAARWGGEEFVVIRWVSGVDEMLQWAQCLRQRVADMRIALGEAHVSVTISVGAGVWPTQTFGPDALEEADEALLQAKREGRNRVVEVRQTAGSHVQRCAA